MAKQEILLESGTNEVELAEFRLCGQSFGVNVAKIREFLPLKGVTLSRLPGRHASVAGIFLLRGNSIALVNLAQHLGLRQDKAVTDQVIVVTDFNNLTTAFVADYINRIYRVSWADFKPLSGFLASFSPVVTGSVSIDGQEVLVLDLEHIIGEIFPQSIINYDQKTFADRPIIERRADVRVFFADDSAIIRSQVGKILRSVGYTQLTIFDNGQAALDAIVKINDKAQIEGKPIGAYLDLLLTDIEMPQMDGLTLCRKVKGEMKLPIKVVMFSSLINEQMAAKCRSVGADAFAAKPETEKLIGYLDEFTIGA